MQTAENTIHKHIRYAQSAWHCTLLCNKPEHRHSLKNYNSVQTVTVCVVILICCPFKLDNYPAIYFVWHLLREWKRLRRRNDWEEVMVFVHLPWTVVSMENLGLGVLLDGVRAQRFIAVVVVVDAICCSIRRRLIYTLHKRSATCHTHIIRRMHSNDCASIRMTWVVVINTLGSNAIAALSCDEFEVINNGYTHIISVIKQSDCMALLYSWTYAERATKIPTTTATSERQTMCTAWNMQLTNNARH